MIAANELRIGNFLYKHFDGLQDRKTIVPVDGVTITDLQFSNHDKSLDRVYKPIPLTEEWLLKFGL